MTKARIYCRVSTDEQAAEGFSLAAQEERLRAYCTVQEWEVAEVYIDDGYSGKDLDRPAVRRMLSEIESGDVIVVYRLDRLTRSVTDLDQLLRDLDSVEAKFASATESFNTTTAMGRFFIMLVALLAQWERENLGERVRMGMSRMVQEGKRPGGSVPFGYDAVGDKLIVNPSEAAIVRRMFDRYMAGDGLRAIAILLNEAGARTKTGGEWSNIGVRYVLRNPIVTGRIAWQRVRVNTPSGNRSPIGDETQIVEGEHEAIIDAATFERVQRIMSRRSSIPPRFVRSSYPLTGVLYCADCGGRMGGRTYRKKPGGRGHSKDGTVYRYYRCLNSIKKGTCTGRHSNADEIEKAFVDMIDAQLSPEQLDVAVQRAEIAADAGKGEEAELRKELATLSGRRRRIMDAYENGAFDVTDLQERLEPVRRREEAINSELAQMGARLPVEADWLRESLRELPSIWSEATPEEKKELVHALFRKIVVRRNEITEVELNL